MATQFIPTATVYENSAGMLRMKLYIVFTSPTKDLDLVAEHVKEHLDYQVMLEKKGIMFAAGPIWDDNEDEWNGEGMVVIRAQSLQEAEAIAAADPMHISGARCYKIRPWLINEGSLSVTLNFSDMSMNLG